MPIEYELVQLHEVYSSRGNYAEIVVRDKAQTQAYAGNIPMVPVELYKTSNKRPTGETE